MRLSVLHYMVLALHDIGIGLLFEFTQTPPQTRADHGGEQRSGYQRNSEEEKSDHEDNGGREYKRDTFRPVALGPGNVNVHAENVMKGWRRWFDRRRHSAFNSPDCSS